MTILHFFLCNLLCICGFLMSISINPIESVLFLIMAFFNAAAILFIFHAEFLGLLFIIIYVGAIAVLFLFVIMMLNIKNPKDNQKDFNIFAKTSVFLLSVFGIVSSFLFLKSVFFNDDFYLLEQSSNIFLFIDSLNNIDVMGQALFNYYLTAFLLAGIILLIALVGAIVLTLRFNNAETSQLVNRQLARTDNNLSFFKTKI